MEMILNGDALEVLQGMEPDSVNTCITSPPYYGLRDYGISGQIGLLFRRGGNQGAVYIKKTGWKQAENVQWKNRARRMGA